MTSIAKLKDRARKHEQKEDWQAAIEVYQRVLEAEEGEDELELELGLYNRIGDLFLRLGQTDQAVSYYEQAADKYAESGFLNNAIALCNKALRHRPGRPDLYLKLSGLCYEQGFLTDARRWIIGYAELQVKAGKVEESLDALEEFAASSDDPDVRELLARHLASHERTDEAVDQLRRAYARLLADGDAEGAERVGAQARELDPAVDLEDLPEPVSDLGELESAAPMEPVRPEDQAAVAADATAGAGDGLEGLEATAIDDSLEAAAVSEADTLGDLETFADREVAPDEELGADEEVAPDDAVGADEAVGVDEEVVPDEEVGADEEAGEGLELEGGLEFQEEPDLEATPGEAVPGAGVAPVPDAGLEPELDEEEPEPLPMLDAGFDEEAEEEPEALPLLDGGHVLEEADEAGAEELRVEAAPEGEAPEGEAPEEEAPEEAEPEEAALEEAAPEGAASEEAAPEEVADAASVVDRARDLAEQGRTDEALQALESLTESDDAGPDAFRAGLEVVGGIIEQDANHLPALQRRAELVARVGDRSLLLEAYVDLADTLARLGNETRAQAMYERVLDLDPENEAALEALGAEQSEEAEAETADLSAVLGEMEFVAEEGEAAAAASDPAFAAMLSQFKAKVTEQAAAGDAGDHYDLGLAFKEMGLIDEAIGEFQTALTAGEERLKVYEELGQCFMLKDQNNVALKVLTRALQVPHGDESELIGVYYLLGKCHEELGHRTEAREAYEHVLAIDDEAFEDVRDRVARL